MVGFPPPRGWPEYIRGPERGYSAVWRSADPEQDVLTLKPVPPRDRVHRGSPLRLHELEAERAAPAGDSDRVARQQRPDRDVVETGQRMRSANVKASAVDGRPRPGQAWRARTRRSSSTAPRDQSRRPPRRRNGRTRVAARSSCARGSSVPAAQRPSSAGTVFRGQPGQRALELRRRLAPGQWHRPLGHDRPGIQPRLHDRERHAALRVTGQDRGRHGRSPPMPWQERRMDVEGRARQRDRAGRRARAGHTPPAAGRRVASSRSTARPSSDRSRCGVARRALVVPRPGADRRRTIAHATTRRPVRPADDEQVVGQRRAGGTGGGRRTSRSRGRRRARVDSAAGHRRTQMPAAVSSLTSSACSLTRTSSSSESR